MAALVACRTCFADIGVSLPPVGVRTLLSTEATISSFAAPASAPAPAVASGLALSPVPALPLGLALSPASAPVLGLSLEPALSLGLADALDAAPDALLDPPVTAPLPPHPLSSRTATTPVATPTAARVVVWVVARLRARADGDMDPPPRTRPAPAAGRCPDRIGAGQG
ncbi:hypothetical protein GCM10011512_01550 [Tersicoccus solisilvae]|uniref:Uncharacterized protein n=1 Tax=Tersicoccus solisilvae TaxID=1882339 RepID=A0ABQ1NJX4_9MICC|nr:hypothetical protein GCM10011512_01550 [Tersicoccus solisilvae]